MRPERDIPHIDFETLPRMSSRRGNLPSHLPRVERVIEPASTLCPCGCGEMARIGEDVFKRLDVTTAQFWGAGHVPPQIRLPPVFKGRSLGVCAGAYHARRTAH